MEHDMVWYSEGNETERELVALKPFNLFLYKEQLKDPTILDTFREESFRVSFHKWMSHRSTLEKRMSGLFNFTINIESDTSRIMISPYDVGFNGSWERLEYHIKNDIRYLRTLGIQIEYSGYIEDHKYHRELADEEEI